MHRRIVGFGLLGFCAALPSYAQEFKVWNRLMQIHGFFWQGFVKTDENNWLTMNTQKGSGAMTDMGLNVSSQLTDRFRLGQVYDRNLGQLGQWHPTLDWAATDYQFTNWFGIRGGKVKTTLGLYNDGYADSGSSAGSYPKNNPTGFRTRTNALVIKTGFNF